MSDQPTDREVYTRIIENAMSPDQLDTWYRSLPAEPSAYQKSLFADGRMWLLARTYPLARMLHLTGPAAEGMRKLTVRGDHVPACMENFLQCRTSAAGTLAWLVPKAEYRHFVEHLAGLGYVEVEA